MYTDNHSQSDFVNTHDSGPYMTNYLVDFDLQEVIFHLSILHVNVKLAYGLSSFGEYASVLVMGLRIAETILHLSISTTHVEMKCHQLTNKYFMM